MLDTERVSPAPTPHLAPPCSPISLTPPMMNPRLTQAFPRWSLHFGNGTAVCQVLGFCLGESTQQQRAIFLPVGKGEEASPPANIELGLLRVAGEAVHGSPDSLSPASPLSLYRELLCFDTSGLCPQGLLCFGGRCELLSRRLWTPPPLTSSAAPGLLARCRWPC